MSWITPIGFLGFIALAVLILIYVLKPNYQQKFISSTYIWRESLKYKRKKIPVSRLRNILVFLFQVIALTACAFLLAQPIIRASEKQAVREKVVVVDASASMLASTAGVSRFQRALEQVRKLANEVTAELDGKITVIVAGETNEVLALRAERDELPDLEAALDELSANGENSCSYGNVTIDEAMLLANPVLQANPETEVLLYTDVEYINKGEVTVVDVKDETESNAAILNVNAVLDENRYIFEIDVASYGKDLNMELICSVYGANGASATDAPKEFKRSVECINDKVTRITLDPSQDNNSIFSFSHVNVKFKENDAFTLDNSFWLYGGKKEQQTINIQYNSTDPNSFFSGVLMTMRDIFSDRLNIEITEVLRTDTPATEGFDFYIFEHTMPQFMPTDGVVFLVDPDKIPLGLNMALGNHVKGSSTLSLKGEHTITKYMNPNSIEVTEYTRILTHDGFQEIMYSYGDPVLLVKNEPDSKVAVLAFSINKSTLAVLPDFPSMMFGMMEYFFPYTTDKFVYDVGEDISLNARGAELKISMPGSEDGDLRVTELPSKISCSRNGVITLKQTTIGSRVTDNITEHVFVKIPAAESNICAVEDVLVNPTFIQKQKKNDLDLYFYFALALVIALFAEWIFQLKEQF